MFVKSKINMWYLLLVNLFLFINSVFGGVLILSPKRTEVSGLKPFDYESYRLLKDSMKDAKIVSFQLESEVMPKECEHLLQQKFTAYVPNVEYIPLTTIILTFGDKQNCDEIKKRIHALDIDHQKNVIYLIFHTPMKVKRSADKVTTISSITSTEENNILEKPKEKPQIKVNINPNEPVLYDSNGQALLYSSQALMLQMQNDTKQPLGNTKIVTYDERDTYSRLSCTIPVDNGEKITLRFRFSWEAGYWYLKSVEVETPDTSKVNLTTNCDVSAPREFSHRCGGETVFTDGTTTLTVFDMQVQPRTKGRRFSDAYNCVPFMTGPIWSGIFVTSILAIGLIIGISALGSIKTMDKFDNSKTKQLTITLMGE